MTKFFTEILELWGEKNDSPIEHRFIIRRFNPLMTKRPPRGDVYLNWTLEDLGNNIYAIRSVSSHLYLDGRNASDSDPLMTNRQPIGDKYLQWTFESTGDNKYAIKSVSGGRYLDGRGGESNPLLTARPPQGDNYLQWVFEVML